MEKIAQIIEENKLTVSVEKLNEVSINRLLMLASAAELIKGIGMIAPRISENASIADENERVAQASIRGFKNGTLLSVSEVREFKNANRTPYRAASFSFFTQAGVKSTGNGIVIEKNYTNEETGLPKMNLNEDYLVQFQVEISNEGQLLGDPSAVVTALQGGTRVSSEELGLSSSMFAGLIKASKAQTAVVTP